MFVTKMDSDHFEDDLEHLQEVFGLEDFEFPNESIDLVSDMLLKDAYSKLNKEDLEDLIDFFKIDLTMYVYSPEKFYAIVSN